MQTAANATRPAGEPFPTRRLPPSGLLRRRRCPSALLGPVLAALLACGPLAAVASTETAPAVAAAAAVSAPRSVDLLDLPAPPASRPGARRLVDVTATGRRLVAVGDMGLIALSDDAGKTWTQAPSPCSVMLTAVSFVDTARGWAVGHDGVVLSSSDGGTSWARRLDGREINAQMLAAAKAQLALAQASPGSSEELLRQRELAADRLADAEAAVRAGASRPLFGVRFIDRDRGFVVGAFGQILETRDGGAHFSYIGDRLPNPEGLHLNSITLAPGGELFIAAEAGVVFRSRDEGASWTRTALGYNGQLYGVVALPQALIAHGFRGRLFRSVDGGSTWQPVLSLSTKPIAQGLALGPARAVFLTQDGELLVTQDAGHTVSRWPSNSLGMDQTGLSSTRLTDTLVTVGARGASVVRLDLPRL